MTGPEHYREAERVRSAALNQHAADTEGFTGWQRDDLLRLAQVHATLALAAATIGNAEASNTDRDCEPCRGYRDWLEAAIA